MRANWLCFVLPFVFASCAYAPEEDRTESETISGPAVATVEVKKEDAYLSLATQRLREQLEIAKLRKSHSQFLDSSAGNLVFKETIAPSARIKTIDLLRVETRGDTALLKLLLVWDQGPDLGRDTIFAKVLTQKRAIGGEDVLTTELVFGE